MEFFGAVAIRTANAMGRKKKPKFNQVQQELRYAKIPGLPEHMQKTAYERPSLTYTRFNGSMSYYEQQLLAAFKAVGEGPPDLFYMEV